MLEKQYRKGPGFIFMSILCILVVLGVIGVKYAFDRANTENAPDFPAQNNPSSVTDFRNELQLEAEKKNREAIGDDGIVHTPEVLPGREIPAELTRPPVLSDEPDKQIFVGYVTSILGPHIVLFNKNKQESLSLLMDTDTKIIYADGSSRRQSEIRVGQEIEVEYELGNQDENAYAHVIRLQD